MSSGDRDSDRARGVWRRILAVLLLHRAVTLRVGFAILARHAAGGLFAILAVSWGRARRHGSGWGSARGRAVRVGRAARGRAARVVRVAVDGRLAFADSHAVGGRFVLDGTRGWAFASARARGGWAFARGRAARRERVGRRLVLGGGAGRRLRLGADACRHAVGGLFAILARHAVGGLFAILARHAVGGLSAILARHAAGGHFAIPARHAAGGLSPHPSVGWARSHPTLVAGVPQRPALWIESSRGNRLGSSVLGDPHLPLVARAVLRRFDQGVMVVAQQDEVPQRRHPAGPPRSDVVRFAFRGPRLAAGERAASVAQHQRSANFGGHEPRRPSDVQHRARTAQHRRQDAGLAAQAPQVARADRLVTDQPGARGLAPELVVVERDDHPRTVAADLGSAPLTLVLPDHREQGVRASLRGREAGGERVALLQRRASP